MIKDEIQINSGDQFVLSVPHVFCNDCDNQPEIELRQKVGLELSFVTLSKGVSFTAIVINAKGVNPEIYNLVLESFDSKGTHGALFIDRVKIVVKSS
jgi:hypothetical protein